MKSFHAILRRITIALLILFVLFLVHFFVIAPSSQLWSCSHRISSAAAGARSVSFIAYLPDNDDGYHKARAKEIIVKRIEANAEQVKALLSATRFQPAFIPNFGPAMCFDPHHRVEIVRRDGSLLRFEICFQCGNLRFDDQGEQSIPSSWWPRLRAFFTEIGIPPGVTDAYEAAESAKTSTPSNIGNIPKH